MPETSVKPYLLRALFEWCNDSGLTPYLTVQAGEGVDVPREHVRDGEIVLNISPLATNRLVIGNEEVAFQARFGGVAREVRVPIEAVRSIYARENGQGMAFEPSSPADAPGDPAANLGTLEDVAGPRSTSAPAEPATGADALAKEVSGPGTIPSHGTGPVPLRAIPGDGANGRPTAVPRKPDEPPPAPPVGGGDRPRLTRVK